MGCAMDAIAGDFHNPLGQLPVAFSDTPEFPQGNKGVFDILNSRLDPAFVKRHQLSAMRKLSHP
jgi:hypothetical protein